MLAKLRSPMKTSEYVIVSVDFFETKRQSASYQDATKQSIISWMRNNQAGGATHQIELGALHAVNGRMQWRPIGDSVVAARLGGACNP